MVRSNRATRAVLRVGDGRGFVVKRRRYLGGEERIVITAAHCLPYFPPSHPTAYLQELTYQALLGPLGGEPTVWAECLFADPIADVAVLGRPDNQELSDEADAYDLLLEGMETLLAGRGAANRRESFGQEAYARDGFCMRASKAAGWNVAWSTEATDLPLNRKNFLRVECQARRSSPQPVRLSASVDRLSPILADRLSVHLLRSITSA